MQYYPVQSTGTDNAVTDPNLLNVTDPMALLTGFGGFEFVDGVTNHPQQSQHLFGPEEHSYARFPSQNIIDDREPPPNTWHEGGSGKLVYDSHTHNQALPPYLGLNEWHEFCHMVDGIQSQNEMPNGYNSVGALYHEYAPQPSSGNRLSMHTPITTCVGPHLIYPNPPLIAQNPTDLSVQNIGSASVNQSPPTSKMIINMDVPPNLEPSESAIVFFVKQYKRRIHKHVVRVTCSLCVEKGWPSRHQAKPSNLVRHLLSHFGIKNYKCPGDNCRKRFTTKDQAVVHARDNHGMSRQVALNKVRKEAPGDHVGQSNLT